MSKSTKHVDIGQRVKLLELCPNIVPSRDKRLVPNVMTLVSRSETRCGLWWYEPNSQCLKFSASAKTHYQLNEFEGMAGPTAGWIRGAVVKMETAHYLLIFACDFLTVPLSGKIISDIYQKVQEAYPKEIVCIVSEEGLSLLD